MEAGGISIVALHGALGELLQCKSSIRDAIGWDAIKEVAASAACYQARYQHSVFEKVAVTNQTLMSLPGFRRQRMAYGLWSVRSGLDYWALIPYRTTSSIAVYLNGYLPAGSSDRHVAKRPSFDKYIAI